MSDETNAPARACTTCKFCLRDDFGYSNWTLEGTKLFCLLGLNPALDGQEEPWREVTPKLAAALDVALTCPRYAQGIPAWLDVEREQIPWTPDPIPPLDALKPYADDEEVRIALWAHLYGPPAPPPGEAP